MGNDHTRKKWFERIAIVVVAVLSVLLLPINITKVNAEDTAWYTDYSYTPDDSTKTLTLTNCTASGVAELTIPSSATIDGITYNNIVIDNSGNGSDSFWKTDASSLKTLTIANGVKVKAGSKNLFKDLYSLTSFSADGMDTSSVTDMTSWFEGCSKLTYLDLSTWDASKVKTADKMFLNCKKMIYLDLPSFSSESAVLVSVEQMFENIASLSKLQDLDMSKINFGKMGVGRWKMFKGAKITNLYLPADPSLNKTDFSDSNSCGTINRIFYGGSQTQWDALGNTLGNHILVCNYSRNYSPVQPQVDAPATDNWYESYNYCLDKKNFKLYLLSFKKTGVSVVNVPAYTKIDGITYNTVLINEKKPDSLWSSDKSSLKELTLDNGVSFADDCTGLFKLLTSLTTVKMNGADMSNVIFLTSLFYGDSSLKSLDFSGVKTNGSANMKSMFGNCFARSGCENFDIRGMDISNADTTGFLEDTLINNLYLPVKSMKKYNFSVITNLQQIFYAGTKTQWDALGNTVDSSIKITYEYTGPIQKSVTIKLNGNGGTVASSQISAYVGAAYGSLPAATRSGYDFAGWFTAVDGGTQINEDTVLISDTEHTLYAHWTKKKVAVLFDGNGGTASVTGANVEYGETYGTLPTATRADYTFAGWYTAKDGGTQVTSATKVTTETSHTLYAHWTKNIVKVSVTFNANGGSVSSSNMEVTLGSTYGTLPTPSKVGYSFDGWFTAASGGSQVTATTTVTTSAAHTLYAHWTEIITEVTVSLSAGNGATVSPGSVKITIGSTYGNLPTPLKQDYKFDGWYTAAMEGNLITANTTLISNNSHTLYAHWSKEKAVVNFDANEGTVEETERKVTIGQAYGELPVPVRTNYSFEGWYTQDVGGDKVTADTIVTEEDEHYLYAHWVSNTVEVTFYAYSGAAITKKEFTLGNKYGELTTPERDGYLFDGWYTKSVGGEKITADTIVEGEEAFTLYAHWVKKTVKVTFNGDKVASVDPQYKVVTPGEKYAELPQPTLDGYRFLGWYTEANGGNRVTSESIVTAKADHILYAHWLMTVTVSFDSNGSGAAVSNKTVTVGEKYGDLPSLTRGDNYDFGGWYTSRTGGDKITADTTVTIANSHVLYARWIKTTITVTYNGDKVSDFTPKTSEVKTGDKYKDLPELSLEGYEFKGWYTSDGDKVTKDTTVTKTSDHILFARWIKLVTISFDGNGDSVTNIPANKTIAVGQKYGELSVPVRSGYDFAGWYTEKTAGDKVTEDTQVTTENSHVLYAHWIKKTITVTFIGDRVAEVKPSNKEVTPGEKYGQLPQLTLKGYEFKGWYTSASGGTKVTSDSIVSESGDHYLFAQWKEEVLKVTVSFDGNAEGVTGVPANMTATVGLKYGELSLPTRTNYTFLGWYTEKTEGSKVEANTIVTNENSHVLYAHWKKDTITVTYNGDKVTNVDPVSKEVKTGEKYGTLPILSLKGYEFKGWYTVDGDKVTADTTVTKTGDHYLIARWIEEELKVTVSFDGNGDGVTNVPDNKTVTVRQKYGQLLSPSRTGYTFEGWYTDKTAGDIITSDTTVTNENSHVLYAHWTKNSIKVTFNGDKVLDVTPSSKDVYTGKPYGTLPSLSLEGYTFLGWYTAATGGNEVTATSTVTENNNHTLFARWKKNEVKVTVSFDGNGDNVSGVPNYVLYTVGNKYDSLTAPSRTGYTFDGWYTEKDAGEKVTADTEVTNEKPHVLYAHWIKTSIIVTFNGDKVEIVDPKSKTVVLGGTYGDLPTLVLDKYEFLGWYTDAVGGTEITSTSTVTKKSDHTLFAHWNAPAEDKTVTVSFDGNGDGVSGIPNNKSLTVGQKYGELASPSRSGYTFDGWYTEIEEGKNITAESLVTNEYSHVLYAHWKKNTIKITLNGDKVTTVDPAYIEVSVDGTYKNLPTLSLTGYTFLGWYTDPNEGEEVKNGNTVVTNSDHILFAHWKEKDKKVTVLFEGNADGVSNLSGGKQVTVGQKYGSLSNPEKDGYEFEGWYTESIGGDKVTADTIVTNELSHVLYAHWVKTSITVTFNGDKVSNVSPKNKEVFPGEQYGQLPDPTLSGYIFKGWFTIGGEKVTSDTFVTEKTDHILFARWQEKDKTITVSFAGNGDGVTKVPANTTMTVGKKYTGLSAPEREGFTFDGWYTDAYEGDEVTEDTIVTNEYSHVLYAHWKKDTITVTLNGDKVLNVASITVTTGGKYVDLPGSLTYTGYVFKGWYTKAYGGDLITADSTVIEKNDHTLFAQWVEKDKNVTVSFAANGDDVSKVPESVTRVVGEKYNITAIPEREGFTFDGWYTEPSGGDKITSDTTVNIEYSHVLYAHWKKNTLKITLNGDKVATVDPEYIEVSVDGTYKNLPTLSLTGYTFLGWYTDPNEGEEVNNGNTVVTNSDHILFAHWQEELMVTVSFDGNGDDVTKIPDNKTYSIGQNYGSLSSPSRNGYVFDGWYTKAYGGDKIESTTKVENNKSHVLYAHWKKDTIIVSFNGDKVTNVDPAYIEVSFNEAYGDLPELSLNGFKFKGWFTEASGGEEVTKDTIVSEKDDHILFAHWEEESLIITVSFSGNGDDVENVPNNKTMKLGDLYGELKTPRRDGFDFEGWYTDPDEGDEITSDKRIKIEHSHTLYAHWKQEAKKVTVILNANRGTVETETIELTVGDCYKDLPVPTREKYRFDGWYTKAVGGELVTDDTEVTDENVHTLYAQWFESGKMVMVSFNANTGEVKSGGKEVEVGLPYGELPEATKDGYNFDGWYTKPEGGIKITSNSKVTQKMAHTIYAHWADIHKKVLVSFNANQGSLSTESKTVSVGLPYGGLPIPSREGYKFDGWYTSITDGIKITKDSEVINEEPHTLFAYWINENDIISVTFNANGGTVNVSGKTIVVGKPYGELPVPVLEGFEFAGWYTDVESGELVTEETEVVESVAHTLFARWKVPGTDDPGSGNDPDNPGGTTGSGTTDPNAGGNATDAGQTGTGTTGTEPVTAIPAVNTVIKDTGSTSYKVTSSDETKPTVSYAGNNSKAKTVTVPKSVTIDGVAYTVTKVEANAFKNNKNVTKIIIDKNITSISKNTFKGCKKLKLIIVKSTNLTDKTVAKGAFAGVGKKVKVKVPKKQYKTYKKLFRKKGLSKKVKIIKG